MLLFFHVVGPVMKLHYSLFKHAQESPFVCAKTSILFNLCDFSKSVAAQILNALSLLLLTAEPWSLLESVIGNPVAHWLAEFKQFAREVAFWVVWGKCGTELLMSTCHYRGCLCHWLTQMCRCT